MMDKIRDILIPNLMELIRGSSTGGVLVCLSILFLFISVKNKGKQNFFLIVGPTWTLWLGTLAWFVIHAFPENWKIF